MYGTGTQASESRRVSSQQNLSWPAHQQGYDPVPPPPTASLGGGYGEASIAVNSASSTTGHKSDRFAACSISADSTSAFKSHRSHSEATQSTSTPIPASLYRGEQQMVYATSTGPGQNQPQDQCCAMSDHSYGLSSFRTGGDNGDTQASEEGGRLIRYKTSGSSPDRDQCWGSSDTASRCLKDLGGLASAFVVGTPALLMGCVAGGCTFCCEVCKGALCSSC